MKHWVPSSSLAVLVSCHTDSRAPSPAGEVKVCLSTGKPGESSYPPYSRKSSAKIIYLFWHYRFILAKQQCLCSSLAAALKKLQRAAPPFPCLTIPYSLRQRGGKAATACFEGRTDGAATYMQVLWDFTAGANEPVQFLQHLSSPWRKEEEISLSAK